MTDERIAKLEAVTSAHLVLIAALVETHQDRKALRDAFSRLMTGRIEMETDARQAGWLEGFEESILHLLRGTGGDS